MSSEDTRGKVGGSLTSPGPFLAKVVSIVDPTYMGTLQVEILSYVGGYEKRETQLHQVKYISPFFGSTSEDHLSQVNDYNGTQKSYGMWMVPPDPGNIVLVFFIDGKANQGYWMGCVPTADMNFQVPGHAATQYHVDGKKKRVPVAEYNKKALTVCASDTTTNRKPASPLEKALLDQGTIEDDSRGITTSSARRDLPSMVFGISTPGPTDHKGPIGKEGKHESEITNKKVSRLGGSTFVMDDGDDKWVRKTKPSEGPPDYASIEDDKSGLREIPHNELVRIRTRTGHQILLHNSEDLIYIGNSRGTAWIELTSDGKMDVYCEDSISFRTKSDFNFYADRDINFEAKRHVNIKAGEEMQLETGLGYNVVVGKNGKITVSDGDFDLKTNKGSNKFTASKDTDIKSVGKHKETAGQIHMNSSGAPASPATEAKRLKTHNVPDVSTPGANISEKVAIVRRMPTAEPYPQHENLDPVKVKKDKTSRDIDGRYDGSSASMDFAGAGWKKYSTTTDTFAKIGKKK